MQQPASSARPRSGPKQEGSGLWLKILLLAFGLVIVVALIADMRSLQHRRLRTLASRAEEPQDLVIHAGTGETFRDPKGLFTFVPPSGWKIVAYPASQPYNAVFYGPDGMDISIMAVPVDYDGLQPLLGKLEHAEDQFGIDTHIEAMFFRGRPAVKRTCRLHHVKLLTIDFVEDRVAHHILCSIPPDRFDQYQAALMEVLSTYRPAGTNAPPS